jgi:DNA-binding PadR family transcriptional regulator
MSKNVLTTEHALLGFLRQRPAHGYEIYQELNKPGGLGLVWRIKQGQLYAVLNRLEQMGLVTASFEPQEGRPPRKMFQLTQAGIDAYIAWISTPVERPRRLRLEFLAKMYFALREGDDNARSLVAGQRTRCRAWLEEHLERAESHRRGRQFEWLVWQLRIQQIEAMAQP